MLSKPRGKDAGKLNPIQRRKGRTTVVVRPLYALTTS